MRDQETEAAIEEAEIKNMELNLQKKMFEQVCNCSHHHFFKFLLGFGCVKYCFYNSLASLIRMWFKTGFRDNFTIHLVPHNCTMSFVVLCN